MTWKAYAQLIDMPADGAHWMRFQSLRADNAEWNSLLSDMEIIVPDGEALMIKKVEGKIQLWRIRHD
jgi:hypothetical protein